MISKKQRKVPELRFRGFTDDWEQRKLGDLADITTGKLDANAMVKNGKFDFYTSGIKKYRINTPAFTGPAITIAGNGATVGYMHYADGPFNAYQRTYVLTNIQGNRTFLFSIIGLRLPKKIQQEARTGNIPYIVMDMLTDLPISLPSIVEQEKIGGLFFGLGKAIALHQRKQSLLEKLKQGYLQKLFPQKGQRQPELRFPGFTDDWEQRKLSSIVNRVTRKNTGLVSDLPLTISAQDGLVDQVTYFNKRVASKNMEHYLLLLNGEFAYNKSYSKDYPWGAIKRLDMYPRGALSTLYIAFKPTSVNSEFLVAYYETSNWYKQVSERAAEGARNHGLLNIAPHDFFDTRLSIPKTDDEQRNIGLFIKKLDHTIALHQQEIDRLQQLKQGYLQKMFV